ncbi:ommochrome-binding protein-like [Anticarsia gemmatalis]|uniref:ommochrome-binding protein-like n=1 Tax=Anticarsia gemmatalis TaxID=129554 RepID=UPI003F766415
MGVVEATTRRKYCDIISNDPGKHCYLKETLTKIPHSPNQLSVDRSTNTLYFSFDFGHGEYVPAILELDTKSINILKGVKDAFAISTDNSTGDVYFGGSHGIYKYNAKQKSLQRLNVSNLDIWWLFVKKHIYFIKFPSLNAYYYEDKVIKPLPELRDSIVHQFVIDKDENIFYINGTGLFGIKHGYHTSILLKDQPRFVGMMTDNNGHVHVCSEDGIYVVTKLIQKVKKVFHLQGILGFTFDQSNNIIYSNSQEIVRLVPVEDGFIREPEVEYVE